MQLLGVKTYAFWKNVVPVTAFVICFMQPLQYISQWWLHEKDLDRDLVLDLRFTYITCSQAYCVCFGLENSSSSLPQGYYYSLVLHYSCAQTWKAPPGDCRPGASQSISFQTQFIHLSILGHFACIAVESGRLVGILDASVHLASGFNLFTKTNYYHMKKNRPDPSHLDS